MIKQGIVNDGILEKKFKILRTSIMLGNIRNREEMMAEYKDTAQEVDKIRRNVYEELLASKMYITTTLEEERDRLKDLIAFTEKRVKERNDFIDDYIKITSSFLDDLPRVSNEDQLTDYKIRLDNIDEYLNNSAEIEELNAKIIEKKKELEEKYESKASNEVINSKLEDELIDEFNKVMLKDEYYAGLNYTDIDNELVKIDSVLADKREVMNTFISSYDALKNAGISGTEREEYLSYVNEAKADYYNQLEKKYMLNIYRLVLDKVTDYDLLYQKRLQLDNILKDRLKNRKELGITTKDTLDYFTSVCNEQFSIIKSQKINMDNIDKLLMEISDCEARLNQLDTANNRSEILDLLKEYSVDKTKIETVDVMPSEGNAGDIDGGIYFINGVPKANNMVVKVDDPHMVNVKNATDTAKIVMKKVVIVLEPKKFNTRRDKLKEAERELEEIKRKEEILNGKEEVTNLVTEDDTFTTFDASNRTDGTEDDVFIDTIGNNVELKTTDENAPVPDEIFVDDNKPETPTDDLFSQTDPFLDDNQFEIDSSIKGEINSNMPELANIGTVKPTSVLSKIEESQKDNEDIILPTMGFTNDEKTNVPIVSENYIN